MVKNFEEEREKDDGGKSYGHQFEEKICLQIRELLINEWNQTEDEKKNISDPTSFEIAICQLVFNNEKVLKLLVDRGTLMKKGDHIGLDKINKKI